MFHIKNLWQGFPGSSLIKDPPTKAGDTGSIPDPGGSTCRGATKPVCHTAIEPALQSPGPTAPEPVPFSYWAHTRSSWSPHPSPGSAVREAQKRPRSNEGLTQPTVIKSWAFWGRDGDDYVCFSPLLVGGLNRKEVHLGESADTFSLVCRTRENVLTHTLERDKDDKFKSIKSQIICSVNSFNIGCAILLGQHCSWC